MAQTNTQPSAYSKAELFATLQMLGVVELQFGYDISSDGNIVSFAKFVDVEGDFVAVPADTAEAVNSFLRDQLIDLLLQYDSYGQSWGLFEVNLSSSQVKHDHYVVTVHHSEAQLFVNDQGFVVDEVDETDVD